MRPTQSLSDLMQEMKGHSSKWINERKFIKEQFEWQEGYGAFSYSKSQVSKVIAYVQNQELHHRKITFMEEYKKFCKSLRLIMMSDMFLKSRNRYWFQPVLEV